MNNYSTKIRNFVYDIVRTHSTYDREEHRYVIDTSDIPDFTWCKLASLIISEDHDYANESVGLDNNKFERSMLPALINMLSDISNKDYAGDFITAWQEGVSKYFKTNELLEEVLSQYNANKAA